MQIMWKYENVVNVEINLRQLRLGLMKWCSSADGLRDWSGKPGMKRSGMRTCSEKPGLLPG